MDSLTQFALGACVARVSAPALPAPKLMLWGGVLATLPDLDSLLIGGDALNVISQHRSWSHSVLMMALATPIVAAALGRARSFSELGFGHRCGLVYAVFVTHVLLDLLTVYGTQVFWPLDKTPYALATLFIIDPLYTLPLIVAGVIAWRRHHQPRTAARAAGWGLALSSAYLALAVAAKVHVQEVAEQWRDEQTLQPDRARVLTMPTPFNVLLWRVLIVEPGAYLEGLTGLLDDGVAPSPARYGSGLERDLNPRTKAKLERVQQFSGPFVRLRETPDGLVAEDLRMGHDPNYVFRFLLQAPGQSITTEVERLPSNTDFSRLADYWPRLWDEQASRP